MRGGGDQRQVSRLPPLSRVAGRRSRCSRRVAEGLGVRASSTPRMSHCLLPAPGGPVHGRDPDERLANERHGADEGRGRLDRRGFTTILTDLQTQSERIARAARRWPSPRTARSSVWSTSRTPSSGMVERFDEPADGHSDGHGDRRQPPDGRHDRPRGGVDDFVAEAKRRTRSTSSGTSRRSASWWR